MPSCPNTRRIACRSGDRRVQRDAPIDPEIWSQIRCERDGSLVAATDCALSAPRGLSLTAHRVRQDEAIDRIDLARVEASCRLGQWIFGEVGTSAVTDMPQPPMDVDHVT